MRWRTRLILKLGAALSVALLAVTPLAVPPQARAATPVGAIPAAFIRNQLTFCGLICPSVVQLVTTVPVGVAQAPLAFVGGLQTGSLLRAIGAAAESVTGPADIATTGIITPDVFIVVPKAIGTTAPIVVVQAFNVAESVFRPGGPLPAIQTAQARILEALNTPAGLPPTELPSGADGFVEVATVAAVNLLDAVAFRAGELLLAGAVHTVNVTATELANTGDPVQAVRAGAEAANVVVNQARSIVGVAVDKAVKDIRASLRGPQSVTAGPKVKAGATKLGRTGTAGAGAGPVATTITSEPHNPSDGVSGPATRSDRGAS